MTLSLWPSIDLRAGNIVRLLKGRLDQETRYDLSVEETLGRFESEGCDGIHIVDLDAAFSIGSNLDLIRGALKRRVPVQVGGGLRTVDSVLAILEAGATRAVLGSLPFTEPAEFERVLKRASPERIVVALDCKEGRPSIRGWVEDAGAGTASEAVRRLRSLGVKSLLVTDVARDGAMTGPNLELLEQVRNEFSGEVLASGGVRGPEDLAGIARVLEGPSRAGIEREISALAGVILGRALHEGKTTVAQLRAALDQAGVAAEARS